MSGAPRYRAPEILLGSTTYTFGVDMWSMGCIFAEMWLRRPFLPTKPLGTEPATDDGQIRAIFNGMGTPREEDWPDMICLPRYCTVEPQAPPDLHALLSTSDDAVDLLKRMLAFDPAKRISASDALEDPYFRSEPSRTLQSQLPFAAAFPREEPTLKRKFGD